MMKMTDEQIRELYKRATPGPWYIDKTGANHKGWSLECIVAQVPGYGEIYASCLDGRSPSADVEFIAATRELVPQLLNRVTSLSGAFDEIASTANWQAEQIDKLNAELKQYTRDIERQNELLNILTKENDNLQLQLRNIRVYNDVLQKRLKEQEGQT